MRAYGPGISLAGATAVVLTGSGFGAAIPIRQLLKLQEQGLRKALERGLAAGKSLKEVMRELDSS